MTISALNQNDVHIWCRNTSNLNSNDLKIASQYLSSDEKARRDRLRFELDRRDFTFAHDLLRRALSSYANVDPGDWQFSANHFGKPSIDSIESQLRALSFNISYTRGWVACAVALNVPLGIDVERVERSQSLRDAANQYFCEEEATWLRQCSDEVREGHIIELWVLKEAFLKATGLGISGPLQEISFRFDESHQIKFFDKSNYFKSNEWQFGLIELAHDIRLAVAIQSSVPSRLSIKRDEGDKSQFAPISMFVRTKFQK